MLKRPETSLGDVESHVVARGITRSKHARNKHHKSSNLEKNENPVAFSTSAGLKNIAASTFFCLKSKKNAKIVITGVLYQ